jgi:integrase
MGMGVCHRGSVAQAGDSLTGTRDVAHLARELLRQDVDPIDHRDQRRETARQVDAERKAEKARERWTLARCARDYHERVIEPTRTTKHAAQWISSLENHMPASLWSKPVADVTAPELLEVLGQIKPHERARNLSQGNQIAETMQRIRQRLEAVFEDAIFHGRATMNPAAAVKRKMRETLPKKKAGNFAALPYKEAPALLGRLRAAPGTAARCLEFAVLTAARTGEVLGAVWSEFDLEAGVWQVPAERMKASGKDKPEPHTVHLSARAVEVLKGQIGQDDVVVFPSPRLDGKPLSNMAMLTALTRLAIREQTTVHGLCRATFSTWAYDTAAGRPDVIEACLAHREADKVKAAYNRAQFTAERRALLASWADYLAQPSAQVLNFDAKAA